MHPVPIALKSVAGLEHKRFFIPSYQRGYRWEAEQVLAMLDDLKNFETAGHTAKFYCLQPLVVVRRDPGAGQPSEWEVVDGQQRLTTLFLILEEAFPGEDARFHIRYERHPEHPDGLGGLLRTADAGFVSPDLHFLRQAQAKIRLWLASNPSKALAPLTRREGGCAKFIWHEVKDRAEAIGAFTRLNAGKIRLEDTELIRALFLRSGVLPEEDRHRIALRWDQMERRLQQPEFWSFVTRERAEDNRISLLFRLLARQKGWQVARGRQIFDRIQNLLTDTLARNTMWQELEDLFSTLEEWFEDNRLFHLVGFLVDQGEPLTNIFDMAKRGRKRLARSLKKKIRNKIFPEIASPDTMRKRLEGIEYDGDHHELIRPLLLCVNLAALDADAIGTVRFSFHAYQAEDWDIEHIRATASRSPESIPELQTALQKTAAYLERHKPGDALAQDIRDALGRATADRTALHELYGQACANLEGAAEMPRSDRLGNLTLLDAETNRGYGNSSFAVKRQWVLGLERTAKYLLPCTRNVFTKSVAPAPVSLLHWTPDDAAAYLKVIGDSLDHFFAETWGDDA